MKLKYGWNIILIYPKITGIRSIGKAIAWLGSRANKIIERQDKRIIIAQIPKASSLRMRETLVAADMSIIEYKQKRKRWDIQIFNKIPSVHIVSSSPLLPKQIHHKLYPIFAVVNED